MEYLTGEANTTGMVNPVTKFDSLGLWMGEPEPFEVSCETSCAVLLQEQDTGEVVSVQVLN